MWESITQGVSDFIDWITPTSKPKPSEVKAAVPTQESTETLANIKKLQGISPLDENNPMHEYLLIETKAYGGIARCQEEIRTVYQLVKELKREMQMELKANPQLSPQEIMQKIYKILKEADYQFEEKTLILQALGRREQKRFDCDTLSAVCVSLAHEFGWPITFVYQPRHIYLVWKEDGAAPIYFETTTGKILREKERSEDYNITAKDYLGVCHSNVAIEYFERANKNYDRCVELLAYDTQTEITRENFRNAAIQEVTLALESLAEARKNGANGISEDFSEIAFLDLFIMAKKPLASHPAETLKQYVKTLEKLKDRLYQFFIDEMGLDTNNYYTQEQQDKLIRDAKKCINRAEKLIAKIQTHLADQNN